MGPREECSLHPAVAVKPCELHPDHLGSGLKPKSTVKAVAGKETLPTSVLRLQPDRVQCMVCHKCGLCCAARKHEVRVIQNHSYKIRYMYLQIVRRRNPYGKFSYHIRSGIQP